MAKFAPQRQAVSASFAGAIEKIVATRRIGLSCRRLSRAWRQGYDGQFGQSAANGVLAQTSKLQQASL